MKKILAGIISTIAVVALCICMTACSTSIEGTWKFESMTMKQGEATIELKAGEKFMGMITLSEDTFVLEVKPDGTLTMTTNLGEAATVNGTWENKDGKYYLTIEGDSQEAKLEGGRLIMEEESMSAKITFKK